MYAIIECPENKGIKTAASATGALVSIIECPENKGIKTKGLVGVVAGVMIIECPENKGIKTVSPFLYRAKSGLSNALKTKGLRHHLVLHL